jgi:ubiquinone/menaquinone biosynthesis C-methylase UbiE
MQLHEGAKPSAVGILLHSARTYDAITLLFTLGRERAFRETMLRFARLKPGEAVLDVGCGTGTTAILAKRQVSPSGRVEGIDASSEMVARAADKAARAELQVGFKTALAQTLPYEAQEFDVVLSTLMFHHLPRAGRQAFAAEAYRVLKPGGRVLVVDFTKRAEKRTLASMHRHGHVDMQAVADAFSRSNFRIVEQGDIGTKGLSYLVAKRAEH